MILRIILGDQLSAGISSLKDIDPQRDRVLMCEVLNEACYVKHHKKKIAFLFSAMRHFATELAEKGINVDYVRLDSPGNTGSLGGEITRFSKAHNAPKVVVTEPGEYRVLQELSSLNLNVEIRTDTRFICSIDEFKSWAGDKKQLRMEYFYREMRKKTQILMDGERPAGGAWNYDSENRKPPKDGLSVPASYQAQTDQITQDVIKLVEHRFKDHFGELSHFHFAVTRQQALYALDKFIAERLSSFGDYQDAMLEGEPWMYHSHLSFYLNCGLLLPLECAERAENAYRQGEAPLNAVEGFIRQILGWREFVRGIYWLKMPSYGKENFLNAKRKLPPLYWGAPTNMNCLSQCVRETHQHAYAHHIQRLMVLGNFALLAGLTPDEVNEWYLIVYADAYEWVELPNVSGMILFADGGYLASKPYAASGAYINKMSNYCKQCAYKVSKKNGADACPFNYLYWDFLLRNKSSLSNNPRLSMPYRNLARMTDDKIAAIEQDAGNFLQRLENGEKI